MLYSGNKSVTTAGTAVPLSTIRCIAGAMTIQWKPTNAGPIYVGGPAVQNLTAIAGFNSDSFADPTNGGIVTEAGPTGIILDTNNRFVNLREMGGPTWIDLRKVYINSDNNGDGVTFVYMRR